MGIEKLKICMNVCFVGLLASQLAVVWMLRPRSAHADPNPGLSQEAVTIADGVTVRVIRDTTSGNLNVCYVASNRTNNVPGSVAVAISCVPERKP